MANIDFSKMNEETLSMNEKAIEFFKANKERLKKAMREVDAIQKEIEEWWNSRKGE